MNTNTRSTRECAFGDMKPGLATAIRKHIERYGLDDTESTPLVCFETTSTHPKKGLFANDTETIVTGVLITANMLIWTTEKERNPIVMSALLRNIDAQDFENTAMYKVKPDSGMNITGRYTDVTKHGRSFIGLGSDPDGEKFRQMLQLAIQKAQS